MLNKYLFLLFSVLLFSVSVVFSQNLTESQQLEVDKYIKLFENYKIQGNVNQQVNYLSKIGNIYWNANVTEKAIIYFEQAIPLSESLGNKNALMTLNNYIGYLYLDSEKYSESEKYFNKSLEIAKILNNKETTTSAMMNIATAQYNQGKYDQAIINLKEAEILGLELNNKSILKKIYSRLAECYLGNNNSVEYAKYFKLSENLLLEEKTELETEAFVNKLQAEQKSLKLKQQEIKLKSTEDSLLIAEQKNIQSQTEIELLENEKKLTDLEVDKKEAEVKEAEALLKKRNTIIGSFLIGLIVLSIFILIVLKLLVDKRKANKLLATMNDELQIKNNDIIQKNKELQDKNIFIEKQNKELHLKNIEIEEQRKLLEHKNIQITESISYASRIQSAILPSLKAILTGFKDAMIYYKPRDIVSGDFYWFSEKENKKFVATVDCTGHSVPGAFMSLIGNTLLNEIINEKKNYNPASILKNLHKGILNTLHQKDGDQEITTDDGMDITLCCYDKTSNKVTIASANHQIYHFNKNGFEIIEGDVFSIGGFFVEDLNFNFTNHEILIDDQTILYFFSDGYADQFGGKEGKKFMSQQFEKLIKNIHNLPMTAQYDKLEENYQQWKGDRKQIDDILVVGIKF
jgi:serine phosphatase RsbU (regulator of sigma subunit)